MGWVSELKDDAGGVVGIDSLSNPLGIGGDIVDFGEDIWSAASSGWEWVKDEGGNLVRKLKPDRVDAGDYPSIPYVPELPSFDWQMTPWSDWLQTQDINNYKAAFPNIPKSYYTVRDNALKYLQSGPIKNALSGDYNWQLFNAGYARPAWQNYRQNVVPSIASAYTAPGANYYSGARMAAQSSAAADTANQINAARFSEYQAIPQRAISAYSSVMPIASNIVDIERQHKLAQLANDMQGINNELNTWAKEQEIGFNVAKTQLELGITAAGLESQYDMAEYAQQVNEYNNELARQSSLYSTIGSIVGLGLGSVGGPVGSMIGSTIGSGLGTYLGGGTVSPALIPSSVNSMGSAYMIANALQGQNIAPTTTTAPVTSTNPQYPANVSAANAVNNPATTPVALNPINYAPQNTGVVTPSVALTGTTPYYVPYTYVPTNYGYTMPSDWATRPWSYEAR